MCLNSLSTALQSLCMMLRPISETVPGTVSPPPSILSSTDAVARSNPVAASSPRASWSITISLPPSSFSSSPRMDAPGEHIETTSP